ncbi:MAG: autotransporter-associated beta strand repeat-containing protein [Pirellulales bacterium]
MPAGTGLSYSLSVSPTAVALISTAAAGDYYWRGAVNNSWIGFNNGNSNFTSDAAGTVNTNGTPGVNTRVIFSTVNATGPAVATTLDDSFNVSQLLFTSSPSGITSVAIGPGAVSTNSLTITPTAATDGIDVQDNAGAISISAPIVLGAAQAWKVSNVGTASLSLTGGLSGGFALTKDGLGTLFVGGTDSRTGTTNLAAGVLQALSANSFSAVSAYTVASGATLRLNGLANAIGSLTGLGTVENGSATAATLTLGGNNTDTTFSGILQNGGTANLGLTKVGAGMFILAGDNTYAGTTTVNAGILQIGNGTTGSITTGTSNTVVSGLASGKATLRIVSGTSSTNALSVGNANGAVGSVVVTGGSFTSLVSTDSVPGLGIGSANGGFGVCI